MVNLIANLIAFSVTIPIVITISIYFIAIKYSNTRWKAIHIAVDYSVPLYILAVATLFYTLFEKSIIGLIFLTCLLVVSGVTLLQWKASGEIVIPFILKRAWRFVFLLFSFLYIVLFLFGLTKSIFAA